MHAACPALRLHREAMRHKHTNHIRYLSLKAQAMWELVQARREQYAAIV